MVPAAVFQIIIVATLRSALTPPASFPLQYRFEKYTGRQLKAECKKTTNVDQFERAKKDGQEKGPGHPFYKTSSA